MASDKVRAQVAQRAGEVCEYCRAPQGIGGYQFHLDHMIPRDAGGTDDPSNLALACGPCNLHKSAHMTGVDAESGATVDLFKPRSQRWDEHFVLDRKTGEISGLTEVGRATAARLQFGLKYRVEARLLWIEANLL